MLADPEKRQIYDEYGEDALKEGMGGGGGGFGGNPFDIFENLFGGNPFGGARAPPARERGGARRQTLTPRGVARRHAGRRPRRPRRPTQGRGRHAPTEGEPGGAVQRNHEEAVAGEERHLLQMRRVRPPRALATPAAPERTAAAVAGREASPATLGAARAARGLGLKSTCARLRRAWCSRCKRCARTAEAQARPSAFRPLARGARLRAQPRTLLTRRLASSRCAGQVISEKDRCPQCRGNKTVQDKKILEVNVERGMQHNQKIVFRGEADEAVRSRRRSPALRPLQRAV